MAHQRQEVWYMMQTLVSQTRCRVGRCRGRLDSIERNILGASYDQSLHDIQSHSIYYQSQRLWFALYSIDARQHGLIAAGHVKCSSVAPGGERITKQPAQSAVACVHHMHRTDWQKASSTIRHASLGFILKDLNIPKAACIDSECS